jgi:hypothetical protein
MFSFNFLITKVVKKMKKRKSVKYNFASCFNTTAIIMLTWIIFTSFVKN